MKHLLNGVAVAIVLALVSPAWSQTATPIAPITSVSGMTAPEPGEGSGSTARHRKRSASKTHAASRTGTRASDNVANQLNAQELSKTGGPAPAPATTPVGQRH